MRKIRTAASVLLTLAMTVGALLVGGQAYAAKKFHDVHNKDHTRATLVVADREKDLLYSLSGDYTAPQKGGTYQMRVIVEEPKKAPRAFTGWKKAKYVGEISHVYRASWELKQPEKFPNGTTIHVQIKDLGTTPRFAL
ncbi:hypothetical protein ACQEVG_25315 [Streptomyces sp. CA-135486]|uniref:hypothetical protein n=1 Tax=Streptomyces sp. CA-135486 TaxID=3240049 RepID=UPI003D8CCF42